MKRTGAFVGLLGYGGLDGTVVQCQAISLTFHRPFFIYPQLSPISVRGKDGGKSASAIVYGSRGSAEVLQPCMDTELQPCANCLQSVVIIPVVLGKVCRYLNGIRNQSDIKTDAMRKLLLQVNMTLDGYVARPDGKTDWMWLASERDEKGFQRVIELAESCDTILMGRKMSREFIDYWEDLVDNQPNSPMHSFAQQMVNMHKIIFSGTQKEIKGRNVTVENGDLATTVKALKQKTGKDIIVYGGAELVSSLIKLNLIDEYYLFINPVAIGEGLPIFREQKILKLESTTAYKNGKVLHKYLPA